MDIAKIEQMIETRRSTYSNGYDIYYRILPPERLAEFSAAVDLRKMRFLTVPVDHPERPKHFCLLAEIECQPNHHLQFFMDEETSFKLAAVAARHVTETLDTKSVIDYLRIWKNVARMVVSIQLWQTQENVRNRLANPMYIGIHNMSRFADSIIQG